MVLVLVLTALVMSGILALVNHITEGPISEQKEKSLTDGIKTVMGGGELEITSNDTIARDMDGDQKDDVFIIHRASSGGKELGAAVESTTQGFGGDFKVLVGFDNEGAILGYTILETTETPGLGAKADTWFQKGEKGDIIGKNPGQALKVKKDDGEVDAITASTITSRAFLKAVNQAYMAFSDKGTDVETSASTLKKK